MVLKLNAKLQSSQFNAGLLSRFTSKLGTRQGPKVPGSLMRPWTVKWQPRASISLLCQTPFNFRDGQWKGCSTLTFDHDFGTNLARYLTACSSQVSFLPLTLNMVHPYRFVVVDETDKRVKLSGDAWFPDIRNSSRRQFSQIGTPYKQSQHATNSSGSIAFTYKGTVHPFYALIEP